MATVVRKSGSPFWFARYRVGGRDVTRSTGTANRRAAEKKLRRWVGSEKGGLDLAETFGSVLDELDRLESDASEDARRLTEIRNERRRMAAELLRGSGRRIAMADAWTAWRDCPRKREPTEGTLEGYQACWSRFQGWAVKRHLKWMHEVSPTVAHEYAVTLKAESFASRTFNGHIKLLRQVFKALRLQTGLADNPFADIPLMELRQESRRALTAEEVTLVLKTATGSARVMIAIGLFTGLRLGDVSRLRWENYDQAKGVLSLVPSKTSSAGKRVTIPVHAYLAQVLAEWRKRSGADQMFPEDAAMYEARPSDLVRVFQRIFTGCGIATTDKVKGREHKAVVRVGFHSLRHSFVSLCAAAGVPQHVVQTLVGHGSPAMTEHYTHVDAEQKRKAIAALPAVDIDPAPQAEKPQ